ncbi:hypothetical protein AAFC00_003482 [Neodothiora populina]|uniref:Uncharacterized protein n=1 Tax=Neodothiora populina TaxID=2781224 RepID=A0ABR3PEV5_9PEZI
MQTQPRTRKRAAPGASPDLQQDVGAQPFQYQAMQDSPFNTDPMANYPPNPYDGLNTLDPSFYNTPALHSNQSQAFATNGAAASGSTNPSNQLVRRDTNQQLATRNPQRNQWNNYNDQRLSSESRVWENMEEDGEQDIDTKAAMAKKDAQAKRKQIPPLSKNLAAFWTLPTTPTSFAGPMMATPLLFWMKMSLLAP